MIAVFGASPHRGLLNCEAFQPGAARKTITEAKNGPWSDAFKVARGSIAAAVLEFGCSLQTPALGGNDSLHTLAHDRSDSFGANQFARRHSVSLTLKITSSHQSARQPRLALKQFR